MCMERNKAIKNIKLKNKGERERTGNWRYPVRLLEGKGEWKERWCWKWKERESEKKDGAGNGKKGRVKRWCWREMAREQMWLPLSIVFAPYTYYSNGQKLIQSISCCHWVACDNNVKLDILMSHKIFPDIYYFIKVQEKQQWVIDALHCTPCEFLTLHWI